MKPKKYKACCDKFCARGQGCKIKAQGGCHCCCVLYYKTRNAKKEYKEAVELLKLQKEFKEKYVNGEDKDSDDRTV